MQLQLELLFGSVHRRCVHGADVLLFGLGELMRLLGGVLPGAVLRWHGHVQRRRGRILRRRRHADVRRARGPLWRLDLLLRGALVPGGRV